MYQPLSGIWLIEGKKKKKSVRQIKILSTHTYTRPHPHTLIPSSTSTVSQSRPSALKQQGVLIRDVEVKDVVEEGYTLHFITTNCMAGMPLLGVVEGEGKILMVINIIVLLFIYTIVTFLY